MQENTLCENPPYATGGPPTMCSGIITLCTFSCIENVCCVNTEFMLLEIHIVGGPPVKNFLWQIL